MTEEEIKKIREAIPHNDVVFEIKQDKPETGLDLKSSEWAVLTQIDGMKSVQTILNNLTFSEEEGLRFFYNLYVNGLVAVKDVRKKDQDFVMPSFFTALEEILIKIIGPVAGYIIDDVLWEMDQTREKFLKEQVPILTESISQEISDDGKRVLFQQEMLEIIKKL
jgi:methionine synthase II (cobalamin-independent)